MTNKTFPNKLKLLGEDYTIKEVGKRELTCKTCGEECMGKIEWDKKTIYISIDEEEHSIEEIMAHELGHYFAAYYGLSESEIFADAFARFILLINNQLNLK